MNLFHVWDDQKEPEPVELTDWYLTQGNRAISSPADLQCGCGRIKLPVSFTSNGSLMRAGLTNQPSSSFDLNLLSGNETIKITLWPTRDVDFDSNQSTQRKCSFEGKAHGYPRSHASINMCDGELSGLISLCPSTMASIDKSSHSDIPGVSSPLHLSISGPGCFGTGKNEDCDGPDCDIDNVIERRVKRSLKRAPLYKSYPDYYSKYSFPDRLYVELVIVHDNSMVLHYKSNTELYDRSKMIVNFLNAFYHPVNIRFALVSVEIWDTKDPIEVLPDADKLLKNFAHFRGQILTIQKPNDNAQLLTRKSFEGGVVGKANKGSMCSLRHSAGVNADRDSILAVASTMAHEIGHNLGLEHDKDVAGCHCAAPSEACIMVGASGTHNPPRLWSTCSLADMRWGLDHGADLCLRNLPPSPTFKGPTCGNGLREDGEECDCGIADVCDTKCCDPYTCKLTEGSICAGGACCDLETCLAKTATTQCRGSSGDCDLPEFCDGLTGDCPADVHKHDGVPCKSGNHDAYCAAGHCKTHNDQCRVLWGRSGQASDWLCFDVQNRKGIVNGNCGYGWRRQNTTKCAPSDTRCGLLHCVHENERPEIGDRSMVLESSSFFARQGSTNQVVCRALSIDFGPQVPDPGQVPAGAKCGDGKMCYESHCVSASGVLNDRFDGCAGNKCNYHGVCNNVGNCHCDPGYAPPYCVNPGNGGSIDSGPPGAPPASMNVGLAVLIFLLVVIPVVTAIITLVYRRRPKWLQRFIKQKTSPRRQPHHRVIGQNGLPSKRPPEPIYAPSLPTGPSVKTLTPRNGHTALNGIGPPKFDPVISDPISSPASMHTANERSFPRRTGGADLGTSTGRSLRGIPSFTNASALPKPSEVYESVRKDSQTGQIVMDETADNPPAYYVACPPPDPGPSQPSQPPEEDDPYKDFKPQRRAPKKPSPPRLPSKTVASPETSTADADEEDPYKPQRRAPAIPADPGSASKPAKANEIARSESFRPPVPVKKPSSEASPASKKGPLPRVPSAPPKKPSKPDSLSGSSTPRKGSVNNEPLYHDVLHPTKKPTPPSKPSTSSSSSANLAASQGAIGSSNSKLNVDQTPSPMTSTLTSYASSSSSENSPRDSPAQNAEKPLLKQPGSATVGKVSSLKHKFEPK